MANSSLTLSPKGWKQTNKQMNINKKSGTPVSFVQILPLEKF